MLGLGQWTAYLTERGGGQPIMEIPFTSLTRQALVDTAASASISLAETSHSEVRRVARPWEHEVAFYRDNYLAFVGPVISLSGNQISLQDLFAWMDVRLIDEDLTFYGDTVFAFRGIFEFAMKGDPSPNISLITHPSTVVGVRSIPPAPNRKVPLSTGGIQGSRTYKGSDVHKAGDLLRELSRTALDFTTVGRTVYAGSHEIFVEGSKPKVPLVLHDGGVMDQAVVTRDGGLFATDVRVFAGRLGRDGKTRVKPLVGRSTGGVQKSGLVQRSYTELLINDLESANLNAESRRYSSDPAPIHVSAKLSPDAAFTFDELLPGRRVDVRLSAESADEEVVQTMRLASVSVEAGSTETITIELVPLGIIDEPTS